MRFSFLKKTPNIDFVGLRRYSYILSLAVLLVGLTVIAFNGGLRYGVDFAGGVMVQIQFAQDVADNEVKNALSGMDLPGLVIQRVGDGERDYLLRFSTSTQTAAENLRAEVEEALSTGLPDRNATIQRLEMVGPKVGADLRNMAVEALFYALLLITVYISGRFEHSWLMAGVMAAVVWGVVWVLGWLGMNRMLAVAAALAVTLVLTWKLKLNFALSATVALLHDVFITLGMLMLLGREIDLNIIAALLTLVGYSLNDKIVIFDRIRENLRALPDPGKPNGKGKTDKSAPSGLLNTLRADMSMADVINLSANQTLSRTLMTSLTTLVTCLSLYLLGGSVIHDFALTILMGVCIGTYSSLFVASPLLTAFGDVTMYRKTQVEEQDWEKPGEHGMV